MAEGAGCDTPRPLALSFISKKLLGLNPSKHAL